MIFLFSISNIDIYMRLINRSILIEEIVALSIAKTLQYNIP